MSTRSFRAATAAVAATVVLALTLAVAGCGEASSETSLETTTVTSLKSPSILTLTPTQLPDAEYGQPYEAEIVISGNRTPVNKVRAWEQELPSGLAFTWERDDNSITIAGTPQEVGRFEFTVTVDCIGTFDVHQSDEFTVTLVVR